MSDRECHPPLGTPDGTVCVLSMAGVEVAATWRADAWDWPHVCPTTKRHRYLPEELAANGWRMKEPPHE